MVYSAIYEDSCDIGFQAAERSGLRVILGKMMMDLGSYGTLQPKKILSVSLLESERLCRKWHGAASGRLEYAFSPRFAVTCSERLMRSAAELAHDARRLHPDAPRREPRGDRKGAQSLHVGARLHRRVPQVRAC